VRATAIVLAITGALALSGIAAPAPAQASRLASTQYGCDPSGGPYPGYGTLRLFGVLLRLPQGLRS
jgi:hypothetical protein